MNRKKIESLKLLPGRILVRVIEESSTHGFSLWIPEAHREGQKAGPRRAIVLKLGPEAHKKKLKVLENDIEKLVDVGSKGPLVPHLVEVGQVVWIQRLFNYEETPKVIEPGYLVVEGQYDVLAEDCEGTRLVKRWDEIGLKPHEGEGPFRFQTGGLSLEVREAARTLQACVEGRRETTGSSVKSADVRDLSRGDAPRLVDLPEE